MRKYLLLFINLVLVLGLTLSGCGKKKDEMPAETVEEETVSVLTETNTQTVPTDGRYIELALNVYYNDSEHGYYSNEAGPSVYVSSEGTYTVSFDADSHLSENAKSLGISELKNLTAVYIIDMGVQNNSKSPLSACNIMYDEVKVNDVPLTITQTSPKSAFKSSGIFDTNDPINAWDGSLVSEVSADSNHVANFVGIDNPKTVSVTFTLSDMMWEDAQEEEKETVTNNAVTGNKAKYSNVDFSGIDSVSLVKMLGNGINLGNTMEAYGHTTLGAGAGVSSYETFWGQPVTTAEMIKGMKEAGFDTLRIPIAWTNKMNYEAGDYTISKDYMDRVETIVNYALDAEMFVIINDHWDGGWWGMFGSKTPDTVNKAWAIYESIWTQVAERFKDYPETLIFESANEELGNSLNDNTVCSDSGSLSENDCYRLTNEINQFFVRLIRKSGGVNAKRFLLIAGYNTDIDKTCDARFVMPYDEGVNRLLLSVHYYTPWNYCGSEKQARWGLKKDYTEMNRQFEKLTKFTDAGYGIVIGEYAALPYWENGKPNLKDNTIEFTTNLLNNCDRFNYCPVLWSCNDLFLKKELKMASSDLTKLYSDRRYEKETVKTDEEYAQEMEKCIASASESWSGTNTIVPGAPVAWIMWNGGAGTYSVGDTYNPDDNTAGIKAHDVMLRGEGEYTVSLDFANGNDGVTFAALGIANGERLFGKSTIIIKEITVDDREINLIADPYTASDDGICTRVNLYNAWVSAPPSDARKADGAENISPVIIDKTDFVGIKNITIKFELVINK